LNVDEALKSGKTAAQIAEERKELTMFSDVLMGWLRQALIAGGTYLATKGYVDSSQVPTVVGAIMVLMTAGWTGWVKWNTRAVPAATANRAKQLQEYLNKLGYSVAVSGRYDEATKLAVKNFQHDHKLEEDGWAGIKTYAALYAELAK
jgi:murein L,D-transpeptidase YcbB/YkuD